MKRNASSGRLLGAVITLVFTRSLCSTSTAMASSMTASSSVPATWAIDGGLLRVGDWLTGVGCRTPTATIRSAPRLMAGLSGAVLRTLPSPK
jgi:hypothetical protein